MFKSIRWTLQLWHAGLLAIVLIGFGTASYFGISRERYQRLDAELERSVQVLVTGFRPPKLGESGPPTESRPWRELPRLEFELPTGLSERFTRIDPDAGYYMIWGPGGEVIRCSRHSDSVPYPGTRSQPQFISPPQIRERGEFREAFMSGPFGTLLVGTSIRPQQAELRNLAVLLTAIGAGVLAIGLAGGWLISRRAVRPIRVMTAVAQEISASNLSRRIDATEVQSELGSLAAVLNEMFSRLEAAFQQQVRFTADASHELRTPLSVIHTHTQLALSKDRSADEYRKTIETCLRASTRMKDLVDSLLLLAGADAGRLSLDRQACDLSAVLEGCIPMVAALAERKRVTITTELHPAELTADPSRLGQVITNLLTNAIRYNVEGGRIQGSVKVAGHDAILTITDTGVGIPAESRLHLFERFYRVDKARSREEGGSGLGLAICKSIVEAHDGRITFQSKVGQGTTFTVRLPLSEATTEDTSSQ